MSRKSDHSEAGSVGDGKSVLSSYETSPRKPAVLGDTGAFGDYSMGKNISNLFVHNMENSSSASSDDQETIDLKMEYLYRLRLIREKLASIDIANKSYYVNCFRYASATENQCKITELTDEETGNNNINKFEKNNKNMPTTKNQCKIIEITDEETRNNNTDESINKPTEEMPVISIFKKYLKEDDNTEQNLFENIESTSTLNSDIPKENISSVNPSNSNNTIENDKEIKTIFYYGSRYKTESSIELLDLNYDPPKKKLCLREKTPVKSPSFSNVNLDNKDSKEMNKICHETNLEQNRQIHSEKVNIHISSDRKCETQLPSNHCCDNENLDTKENSEKTKEKDDFYVLFLNTLEGSHSVTPETHRTIVTDTTITDNSPVCKRKKRRILMRSARNKVKPVDNMTLWEEIRTMEALNQKKCQKSLVSRDSSLEKTLPSKSEVDACTGAVSRSSLDVSRKVNTKTKFPSITKISKYCPFTKKSQVKLDVDEKLKNNKSSESLNVSKNKTKEQIPVVAEGLLKLRKEQELFFESTETTLSAEKHSDYSEPEEDIDDYFEPFCVFCFCL